MNLEVYCGRESQVSVGSKEEFEVEFQQCGGW